MTLIPRRFFFLEVGDLAEFPRFVELGTTVDNGNLFVLEDEERDSHMYVRGVTSSGKSRLLESIILQDISLMHPQCVLDPTGQLYTRTLDFVAYATSLARNEFSQESVDFALDRLRFFDLADPTNPFRVNPLLPTADESTEEIVDDMLKTCERLFGNLEETRRLRNVLRSTFWVAAELNQLADRERPEPPAGLSYPLTMQFVPLFFAMTNEDRMRYVDAIRNTEQNAYFKSYWTGFSTYGRAAQAERFESSWNALQYFLGDTMTSRFFGAQVSTLSIPQVMREGISLFCHLPLGRNLMGSQLVGTYLLTKLQRSAYRRSLTERQRRYYLVLDEFHRWGDIDFADGMTNLRQFGLSVVVAHQNAQQPPFHTAEGQAFLATVKGNAQVKVLFRQARGDAEEMAKEVFELSQRRFNFEFKERTVGHGKGKSKSRTVSFTKTVSVTRSWSSAESRTLAETDGYTVAESKGTNIGETLTEGFGETVAEGVSETITNSKGETVTELHSKTHGISLAIGKGWTHMRDHGTGFTHTETDAESLSISRGSAQTRGSSEQKSETTGTNTGNTVTDSAGNSLTHTQSGIAYSSKGGAAPGSTAMSEMSSHANAYSETFNTAVGMVQGTSESASTSEGETRGTSKSRSRARSFREGERNGVSGQETTSNSDSETFGENVARKLETAEAKGTNRTTSRTEQHAVARAFQMLQQLSRSFTKSLQESLAKTETEGVAVAESQADGVATLEGTSKTVNDAEATRRVYFSLEGEREITVNDLQKLAKRECVVVKRALSPVLIRTLDIPEQYFYHHSINQLEEILTRQRAHFGARESGQTPPNIPPLAFDDDEEERLRRAGFPV